MNSGELDVSSPGENGKFVAKYCSERAGKCVVNVGTKAQTDKGGGHDEHMVAWLKGDLCAQILAM